MTRTIISIDPENKQWLERTARAQGVPMAGLVREAIRRMRQQEDVSLEELLKQTSGLWKRGDGLAYQRRLRKEWR
ncbi:MAG: CopG family transcriptional regulator [Acidobacteriota bacterium]